MSRTYVKNQRDGKNYPKKSRRKLKDQKYFGERYGDGSRPGAKKGEDFMNHGYPMELRHHKVIKNKIMRDVTDEMLDDLD
jgi:hypothetical protein